MALHKDLMKTLREVLYEDEVALGHGNSTSHEVLFFGMQLLANKF